MPGKSAHDPVFIKELEYEYSRLTRRPTFMLDNDATSCFDRIPAFLGNVMSRKFGMSKQVCIVAGRTLKEAKYYLKTKIGISNTCVTHSRAMPWFGTGQGATNSVMH